MCVSVWVGGGRERERERERERKREREYTHTYTHTHTHTHAALRHDIIRLVDMQLLGGGREAQALAVEPSLPD